MPSSKTKNSAFQRPPKFNFLSGRNKSHSNRVDALQWRSPVKPLELATTTDLNKLQRGAK